MEIITKCLENNAEIKLLRQYVNDDKTPVYASGTADSQKAQLIVSLGKKSSLVIAENAFKAKEMYEDMSYFNKTSICLYPAKDIIFYSADIKSREIIKSRFDIISRLIAGEELTVITTMEALLDRLVPPEVFKSFVLTFKVGDEIKTDELARRLVLMGYERCEAVEAQGQFAIRGGIIDVYSSIGEYAYRLELWGDEIDSIRIMDSFSQRSVENAESVTLYPISELIYEDENINKAIAGLRKNLKQTGNTKLQETLEEAIERLENERFFSGVEKYINWFYDETAHLLDYMSKNTVVWYDEPNRIHEHCEQAIKEFTESVEGQIRAGVMLPQQMDMIYPYSEVIAKTLKYKTVLLSAFMGSLRDFKPKQSVDFKIKSTPVIKGDTRIMFDDLEFMYKHGYTVLILGGGAARCQRIYEELLSRDMPAALLTDKESYSRGVIYIGKGGLTHSFEYIEDKFAVISLNEQEKKQRRHRGKKDKAAVIENFNDLKIGDYVVHENYGIGVFRGIEQKIVEGAAKDYIKIGYADDSNLYIAPNRLDLLQKYIGGSENGQGPKLSKLGGTGWAKAKARAKKAANILAKDLIEIYAKRQAAKGVVYGKDTLWQHEFEEAFPFEETQDQLDAIADVKADMEQGRVMDRLICGDVGFGKTEVALRAAFKTVQEGRQVAYLVPTTILANQHYQTFAQRMAGYPVTVSLLNRFRTPKEQKMTVNGLEKGTVDVVIGTHRLLSKDVKFKDLGLIIVDEEQRFGVGHKEKLKSLKSDVNILTLTATPIPRTLHMSLSGIRDMSLLTEPPNDRIPIQTYVMEYNPEFVRDAIHRELARGGQVFYLHNRVQNIADTTLKLQKLVPEASFAFAHGQMSERELENVMLDFMEGAIDVLVCTTIVETGLDIPNVNTIIIQDADRMGLSQLYQLRGRVGRSTRTSFAYLMYKKEKVLQEVSQKRLQTIKEFTQFGSGFKIAMRDLEIRGAGNLLGGEQHGHMDSIGYELYCKLLDEAVRELRGEQIEETYETLMDITVNAFIPESYISNLDRKIEIYKRIAHIKNKADYFDVQDELEDRYGNIPRSVANLLDIAYTKALLHDMGAVNVSQRGADSIVIAFKGDKCKMDVERLMELIRQSKGSVTFTNNPAQPYITIGKLGAGTRLALLKEFAEKLAGVE